MLEVNSLLEIFALISAGASIVIAAVAIGFSIIYYSMVIKAFRRTEEAAGRSEKSVNQIYVMLTKLSHRTQDESSHLDEQIVHLATMTENSKQLAARIETSVSQLALLSERSEQLAGLFENNVGQLSNLSHKTERVAGIFQNNVDQLAHLSSKTEASAGRIESNVGYLADLKKQLAEQMERPLSQHFVGANGDAYRKPAPEPFGGFHPEQYQQPAQPFADPSTNGSEAATPEQAGNGKEKERSRKSTGKSFNGTEPAKEKLPTLHRTNREPSDSDLDSFQARIAAIVESHTQVEVAKPEEEPA